MSSTLIDGEPVRSRNGHAAIATRRQLVAFGLIMATAFAVIAFVRVRAGLDPITIALIAIASGFFTFALVAPLVLLPAHRWWMRLAEVLGWINTRVLLTLVYYLVVTPIGLLLRLAGRSPLAIDRKAVTFWRKPPAHSWGDRHFEKQF